MDRVDVPPFTEKDVPQCHESEVWLNITKIKPKKATVPGHLPAKLIKEFAAYLADPFTNIIKTSSKRGEYPEVYEYEISTPVLKVYPPEGIKQMRNISGLLNFDKVMEKMIMSQPQLNLNSTQKLGVT